MTPEEVTASIPTHTQAAVRAMPLHVVAVAVLLLGVGFGAWRLSYPTECAWVPPSSSAWTETGVRPGVPAGCALTEGQTVTDARSTPTSVTLTMQDVNTVTLPLTAPGPVVAQRIGHSASSFAFVVALFALTVYAVRRRPHDPAPAALLVFACGLLGSTFATMTGLPVSASFDGGARWLWFANVQVAFSLCWGGMLASLLHVPAPAAPSSGTHQPVGPPGPPTARAGTRLTWITLLAPVTLWAVLVAVAAIVQRPTFTGWMRTSIIVQSSITVLAILAALALTVSKVRAALRADPADVGRQQILWLAGSSIVSASLTLGLWMVPDLLTGEPLLPGDLIGAPGLAFVAGLALTMLRYRLFDLDVVLTRTIVYSVLILVAVASYLLVTAVLVTIFGSVADGPIAAVGAVVVALAANPLRVRLERLVNRVFYGDRHEPYVALSRIAEHVADRHRPLESVAEDIRRSLRVPYLAIEPEARPAMTSGRPEALANGIVELVAVSSDEDVGRIILARRGRGERFSATERRLLDDITRELAGRLRADRMAQALQQSRERLVTAREEERKALRRTLHDDIGPTMAAVAFQAETARRTLEDPTGASAAQGLLGEIAQTASRSAESLRSLAYDLRPPALDDLGLVAAIHLVAHSTTGPTVEVTADGLDDPGKAPLGAAVEVAAYRIVKGAVDNVTRHANAGTCWVRLVREPDRLVVVVEDDGSGMPPAHPRGVGLTSMAERAAELGGTCHVSARPGGGTVVRAELANGTLR